VIPRLSIIVLAAVLAVAGIAVAFFPAITNLWLVAAGLIGLAALADGILCLLTRAPAFERKIPGSMSLMTWTDIQLTIRNEHKRGSLLLQAFDHHPPSFESDDLPLTLKIKPGRFVDAQYRVRPLERGSVSFPGCDLRIASPLRLWWRRRFVEALIDCNLAVCD